MKKILPKIGDRVRIVKKNVPYNGYIGTIQDIIEPRNGERTFGLLIVGFCKDGSAIAPKVREHEVEGVAG